MNNIIKSKSNFNLPVLTLLCLLFSALPSFADSSSGVLVSSKASSIQEKIKRKDLRRIFLGIRPASKYQVAKPVLNTTDKNTYALFLKNILFLTESGYKRKLIKRVFRQGADAIQSIDSHPQLEQHLLSHPNDISFMSKQQAENHPNLKIIQELW